MQQCSVFKKSCFTLLHCGWPYNHFHPEIVSYVVLINQTNHGFWYCRHSSEEVNMNPCQAS